MNPFVRKAAVKRIRTGQKLTGCFILIALVTSPLVFALIFSESMMNGITEKYICLSDGHIQTSQSTENIPEEMIYSSDKVLSANVLIYSSTETSPLYVKGVEKSYFNERRNSQMHILEERKEGEGSSNLGGITISRYTAQKLGVSVGDKVALMIVPEDTSKTIRPVLAVVDKIFYTGYDTLDKLLSYVDYSYAEKVFGSSSFCNEILVNPSYAERLNEVVSYLDNPQLASLWTSKNSSIYQNFISSRQMIIIILLLVVFVAAFYTASVANQIVEEDMKRIAISKLIGASDRQVRSSVFISVYIVTISGIICGCILGLLLSFNMGPILSALSKAGIESLSFYLLDFDIVVPYTTVMLLMAALLVISFISVKLTLRRTVKITPVQLFTSL
ncbi:MAG: FtsX-like permease family protein [Sphaerochaetaceae bacterium]|nr:FtsX-like permease family protein [Sphaerochaetaceae bacterium]